MLRAESELHAVHIELTNKRRMMRERVESDRNYCDVELGALWLWGICMKLGGGWCSGEGPWYATEEGLVKIDEDHPLYGTGNGITRSVPCVGNRGVLRQDVSDLKAWMRALSSRLRDTLILNGDWSRAVTPAMMGSGTIGIMFDPPYGAAAGYNGTLYTNQNADISTKIRTWCVDHGDDPNMRIAYCGYAPEGDILERHGWVAHRWKAQGGYGNQGQANQEKVTDSGQTVPGNRFRECVWFSPTCGYKRHLMGDIHFE
jgi:hypothetical protein